MNFYDELILPPELSGKVTQMTFENLLQDFEKELRIKPVYENGNLVDNLVEIPIYRGESLQTKDNYIKQACWTLNPLRALSYSLDHDMPCVLQYYNYYRPTLLNKRLLINRWTKPFDDASNDTTKDQRSGDNYKVIEIVRTKNNKL